MDLGNADWWVLSVDGTSRKMGYGMLSFLDAFSDYLQIPMHSPDAEKMTFITPHGLYCYNVIPFGLKNARVTCQRLVTKIFRPLMGNKMEVYIDDMLVNYFRGLSNRFASEGSPIYLPNLGSKFSRTKSFCFENWILYSHLA